MTLTEKIAAEHKHEAREAREMWIGLWLVELAGAFVVAVMIAKLIVK